ncbi:MAG: pentapeptide repeat-containing protein [SAR202 cluster bacterium]|nr:pentapeptide repeat-containing protein [SAR202 cluster bacterium]
MVTINAVGRRVGIPAMTILLSMFLTLLLFACGGGTKNATPAAAPTSATSGQASQQEQSPTQEVPKTQATTASQTEAQPVGDATSTPLPGRREAVLEGGTPVNKAGTANVTPLPNQIGDCILKPKTDCQGANLRGSDLSPARANSWSMGLTIDLSYANFSKSDWTGSDLTRANLEGINLTEANLNGVSFKEAVLFKANLTGANLTDAKFDFADLEDTIMDGVIYCRTKMNDGTTRNDNC